MKKQKSEVNDRFIQYFQENFFSNMPDEMDIFIDSLTKPLPKTIRINTNRMTVADFKVRATKNNWILTPTHNPTVFRIDRSNITMPLGHTLEHLLGYFYIQELSASMSVHYLANGEINNSPYLILDMAASPGGKTTQLAEHFPASIIVANEPARDRMAQLVSNTERLGNERTMITNYDGGFYRNLVETFDRILIDAPCSGEGIGFKESQTVKYWNLKNIHTIARLQTKLLDAAFRALKTGGEVLYSTCTLNMIENEGVVHAIQARYPESFEILFEKRFWPHKEASGGFFVCKIRKNQEIAEDTHEAEERNTRSVKTNEELLPVSKDHERLLFKFSEISGLDLSIYHLFEFKRDILAIEKNQTGKMLLQKLFPVRLGKRIGRIEEGVFTPDNRIGRDLVLSKIPVYEILDEKELDEYLRGAEIGNNLGGNYRVIKYDGLNVGLESIHHKSGRLSNTFPREWLRR